MENSGIEFVNFVVKVSLSRTRDFPKQTFLSLSPRISFYVLYPDGSVYLAIV
jgi:hypothetical protein